MVNLKRLGTLLTSKVGSTVGESSNVEKEVLRHRMRQPSFLYKRARS